MGVTLLIIPWAIGALNSNAEYVYGCVERTCTWGITKPQRGIYNMLQKKFPLPTSELHLFPSLIILIVLFVAVSTSESSTKSIHAKIIGLGIKLKEWLMY